jgi:hypothetical protein
MSSESLKVTNEREADLFVERVSPKIRKDASAQFDDDAANDNDGIANLTASGRYNIDPDVPSFVCACFSLSFFEK